ncbi:hypothetical protein EV421DRAFT_1907210 [Armillaria borealis]|uniref:Uncharacterized protein n=1 Tax=Armillaria borealis TaxID=47425 RepID=A0AA39J9V8_9AGAR|nr:hypothetical protein EV421DRAFT_1907210 [Armillaria borealis]
MTNFVALLSRQFLLAAALSSPISEHPISHHCPAHPGAAIAPSIDHEDWYMPVQSSPCPAPSSSKVPSHCQSSTHSSPRVPQPFPDIPPLDEPNWPRQKPDSTKRSISMSSIAQRTQSSNIGEGVKIITFVEIICWLEDGELPHHAILPESFASEIILQRGHVVLGQAGIEKVRKFFSI